MEKKRKKKAYTNLSMSDFAPNTRKASKYSKLIPYY